MKSKTVPSVYIYGYVDSFTRKAVVLTLEFCIVFRLSNEKFQQANATTLFILFVHFKFLFHVAVFVFIYLSTFPFLSSLFPHVTVIIVSRYPS